MFEGRKEERYLHVQIGKKRRPDLSRWKIVTPLHVPEVSDHVGALGLEKAFGLVAYWSVWHWEGYRLTSTRRCVRVAVSAAVPIIVGTGFLLWQCVTDYREDLSWRKARADDTRYRSASECVSLQVCGWSGNGKQTTTAQTKQDRQSRRQHLSINSNLRTFLVTFYCAFYE